VLITIRHWFNRLWDIFTAYIPFVKRQARLKTNRGVWEKYAQVGELDFHKKHTWRRTNEFMERSGKLFEFYGLNKGNYVGKTVIDLGAGSRLKSKYFSGARVIAIEPLAEQYMAEIEWCDLGQAQALYARPAEEKIIDLIGEADLLISINVLDHCFDFEKVTENIRDYLKPDGLAFLSFDKHDVADKMHPLELNETICEQVFIRQGLKIVKFNMGFGGLLGDKQTYGFGDYCMNYWLKRNEA